MQTSTLVPELVEVGDSRKDLFACSTVWKEDWQCLTCSGGGQMAADFLPIIKPASLFREIR